jgi:CRP-like cAMP-binding protein
MAQAVLRRSFGRLAWAWPEHGTTRSGSSSATRRTESVPPSALPPVALVPSPAEIALRRQRHAAEVLRETGRQQLIDEAHAAQIAALLRITVVDADQDVLARVGHPDRGMLVLLLRGEVRAEMRRTPHAPLVWGVLGAGQWLGELPASMGGVAKSSMAYYANSPLEVGVLPVAVLQDMLLNRPALAASLLMMVSHQLGARLRYSQERALLQHQWMSTVAAGGPFDSGYGALDIEFN